MTGSGVWGASGLAVPAEPEQLEPVAVNPEAGSPGDLGDCLRDAAVLRLRRSPAARADHVMVVGPGAGNVRMFAAREVQPLDDPELGQQFESPEEGRPADSDPAVTGEALEIGRREVTRLLRDEIRDGTPGLGQAVAGEVQGSDDRVGVWHGTNGSGRRPSCRDSISTSPGNTRRAGSAAPGVGPSTCHYIARSEDGRMDKKAKTPKKPKQPKKDKAK